MNKITNFIVLICGAYVAICIIIAIFDSFISFFLVYNHPNSEYIKPNIIRGMIPNDILLTLLFIFFACIIFITIATRKIK